MNPQADVVADFVRPICAVLHQLGQLQPDQALRGNAAAQAALEGACHDLCGLTASCHNRKTYRTLFSVVSQFWGVFARAAGAFFDRPTAVDALFQPVWRKFLLLRNTC